MAVRFVPPGDLVNPYRLGTAVTLSPEGWRLVVNSATIDADAQVEAVTAQHGAPLNPPPPPGFQYALANVSMTNMDMYALDLSGWLEGGPLDPPGIDLVENAPGTDQLWYPVRTGPFGCTPPPPDLNSLNAVPSAQTNTGNLCFLISSEDASTALLYALGGDHGDRLDQWFALH